LNLPILSKVVRCVTMASSGFVFWGLKVPAKSKTVSFEIPEDCVLHLSNASLGVKAKSGRNVIQCHSGSKVISLAVLSADKIENATFDLIFPGNTKVEFSVEGQSSVSLSGYLQPLEDDMMPPSDVDSDDASQVAPSSNPTSKPVAQSSQQADQEDDESSSEEEQVQEDSSSSEEEEDDDMSDSDIIKQRSVDIMQSATKKRKAEQQQQQSAKHGQVAAKQPSSSSSGVLDAHIINGMQDINPAMAKTSAKSTQTIFGTPSIVSISSAAFGSKLRKAQDCPPNG